MESKNVIEDPKSQARDVGFVEADTESLLRERAQERAAPEARLSRGFICCGSTLCLPMQLSMAPSISLV